MKKALIGIGAGVLLILAIFWGLPMLENIEDKKVEGSGDWMSRLTGSDSLADMNIPGTHNSGTQYAQFPFFSKCQSEGIRSQLEMGYRYLDIRLRMVGQGTNIKLAFSHGPAYCKTSWSPLASKLYLETVLEECYSFLEDHPGETILFVVKKEDGKQSIADFQTCLNTYIQGNSEKWLLTDEVPTLENARGKIVLFRRYKDEANLGVNSGIPFLWEAQSGTETANPSLVSENEGNLSINVQDWYELASEEKWKVFQEGAKTAEKAKYGEICLSFLSTKGRFIYGHPYRYAKKLNEKLMNENAKIPRGWTVVDFGSSEIAEKIYSTNKNVLYAGAAYQLHQYNELIASGQLTPLKIEQDSSKVYSFLQGPKAWESKVPWSGAWCMEYLEGKYFGSFGCGLCCAANIYDTLAEGKGSPLDAYYFARENTAYQPNYRTGAIGWGDLKYCLRKMGMVCDLYYKPDTYEEFQRQMKMCKSAIVLVSSRDDDRFWENTKGHYVNIWCYNADNDKVYLAEPGSPENNGTWIPLRYVYDALKTLSEYQYIRVDGYNEENDLWHPTGINDDWVKPQ